MGNAKNIKILSVSDVVEPQLDSGTDSDLFEGIDLIISCGDLPPEYLSRLVHFCKAPLYYVKGNHDIRFKDKQPMGGDDLHGRLVNVAGLNILGLEGSILGIQAMVQQPDQLPEVLVIARRMDH